MNRHLRSKLRDLRYFFFLCSSELPTKADEDIVPGFPQLGDSEYPGVVKSSFYEKILNFRFVKVVPEDRIFSTFLQDHISVI